MCGDLDSWKWDLDVKSWANPAGSYRITLNQNEKTDDEEQQNISLKACHQRCADRTLKVLEKNGSIFIKLGQHLVSGSPFPGV